MDSSQPWNHPAAHHHHHRPCPHQPPHHHLHFSPNCPLHSRLLQHVHPHPHGPHPYPTSLPFLNSSISQVPQSAEAYPSDALMMQEGNEEAFEEDEEDPIFVLTDEWREFFAKSEAKRRLAKKEARKKGKASAG